MVRANSHYHGTQYDVYFIPLPTSIPILARALPPCLIAAHTLLPSILYISLFVGSGFSVSFIYILNLFFFPLFSPSLLLSSSFYIHTYKDICDGTDSRRTIFAKHSCSRTTQQTSLLKNFPSLKLRIETLILTHTRTHSHSLY